MLQEATSDDVPPAAIVLGSASKLHCGTAPTGVGIIVSEAEAPGPEALLPTTEYVVVDEPIVIGPEELVEGKPAFALHA